MSVILGHIMIIDDNADILAMLSAMLKHKGYKVSVKEDMENVESAIREFSPDVILMDMLLAGGDGCELCKRIKADQAFANVRIVMMSAHPHARSGCLEAGADHFLGKPFDMNELLRTLTNLLITIDRG